MVPVTLSVPPAEAFRILAADVVLKYAWLCGCAEPDVEVLAGSLASALGAIASGAAPDRAITLECRADAAGVHVAITGSGQPATLTCRPSRS
jgi:hypothetical protein